MMMLLKLSSFVIASVKQLGGWAQVLTVSLEAFVCLYLKEVGLGTLG
jgi:hypothetical protein